jgi:GNAT superfamily N-acetyltransferase
MTETHSSHQASRHHSLETTLESTERQMYSDLYEALPESVARHSEISWNRDEGSLALTCRRQDHPFFNRLMGIRHPRGGIAGWLGEVVEHYRRSGVSRWMLQIPPSDSTPDLTAALRERGLVPLRGWAKHAGAVETLSPDFSTRPSDLRVETIDPERARDWAAILAPAFGYPDGSEAWPAATVGRPGWLHFLAYDGDLPAACAALFVSDGVGILGFAATLPSHRRRGAQSALIAARFRAARRLGLTWLATETDEELPDRPNPSYHNIIRAGMPVRYVRANWGPPPPG